MESTPLNLDDEAQLYSADKHGAGIRIFLDRGLTNACLPVKFVVPPGEKPTKEDFAATIKSFQAHEDFKKTGGWIMQFMPSDEVEILEIGQGEQTGLVRMRINNSNNPYNEMWIERDSLEKKSLWRVERRKNNPLEGPRLNEICDPSSAAVLRRTDNVRKMTIYAMGKKRELEEKTS